MLLNIKARLAMLGKKSADVITELYKHGITVHPSDFSAYINNRVRTPKANKVIALTDKIIKEWEKK